MDSTLITVLLPLALGIVMLGLGLSLTVQDFVRVARVPKATLVALGCQMLILPVVCFGLVTAFGMRPTLAVGMMLLAASPGGTTANLFSHLAGGDVALNITLTAINSVLAVVTLPIVVGLSIAYFMGDQRSIGMQPGKVLQVFAIVLVPVAIGMWIRRRWLDFAVRMERPVKIASAVVLALVIVAAIVQEWEILVANYADVTLVALLLVVLSLTIGYWVPRLFGVERRQAIASSMEVGIHNATLAIAVAVSVLGSTELAVAPAGYGILMFFPAAVAAWLLARRTAAAPEAAPEPVGP
ncbi:MAG: bile acid:sodium symporter family protein [Micromonosporaceae bacterium]